MSHPPGDVSKCVLKEQRPLERLQDQMDFVSVFTSMYNYHLAKDKLKVRLLQSASSHDVTTTTVTITEWLLMNMTLVFTYNTSL